MKKYTIILFFFLFQISLSAQESFDLLRYSMYDTYGTARSMSMANAFGALGGDAASIRINPAGVSVYRSYEISYTPVLGTNRTYSIMDNKRNKASESFMKTANFGWISTFCTQDESGFSNFNLGVTYNQLKNYNRNTRMNAYNRPISLLDNLTEGSRLEEMAYQTYLLDELYVPILKPGERVDNNQSVAESGNLGEWDFSFGFNYAHILYFGVSMGIQSLNYTMDTYYEEYFAEGGSLRLVNYLNVKGVGINGNIGVIIRPTPALRLGFAYHSPTRFDIRDNYDAYLSSYDVGAVDENGNSLRMSTEYVSDTEPEPVDYKMETPSRYVFSVAFQLKQKALLSIDYEYADYSSITMSMLSGIPYVDVNESVRDYFRSAGHLRIGAEYRLGDHFMLRAGYAYSQSPVQNRLEKENTIIYTPTVTPHYFMDKGSSVLSTGFGYRIGTFFMDFVLLDQVRKEHFYPYYTEITSVDAMPYTNYADVRTNNLSAALTFGLKF